MNWQSELISLLSAALLRPFALAAAAWLILRIFRVRHPSSQHSVWTAVLIGMLLLPILSVFAPHWKLPVLPPHNASQPAPSAGFTPPQPPNSEPIATVGSPVKRPSRGPEKTFPIAAGPSKDAPKATAFQLPLVLWLYFAGLFTMIAYRVTGWVLLRQLVSRSTALHGSWLRESSDVLTPVAVGVLRPAVLLPTAWRDWSLDTRTAVLTHEFAHIRRHDALVSALSRFANCVLWFHPLAWWVSRCISDLAELACDAAVLERTHNPAGYSRVLLAFADGVNRAGHRVALPGLAIAGGSAMGRRIDQVFELSNANPRKLARPGVVLALLGVPVMCLAAAVGLRERPPALQAIVLPAPLPPAPAPHILAQAQAPAPKENPQQQSPGQAQGPGQAQTQPQAQDPVPADTPTPPDTPTPTKVPASRIDGGPNLYPREKEAALGAQLAEQLERNVPLILDKPQVIEYVNRLGGKLAAQLTAAPFAYTYAITANDLVNSLHEPISLPGGYIFISPSLFRSAQDESEFAGMLAHAMAHVAARHGTRQATKAELSQMTTIPLIFYGGWAGFGARQASRVMIPIAFLQFARAYEQDADELAVQMISGAGFNPESLVNYYRRVWTDNVPGTTSKLFDVTGSRDDRIAAIERTIQKLTPPAGSTSSDEFLRIREQIPEPKVIPGPDRPRLIRRPN